MRRFILWAAALALAFEAIASVPFSNVRTAPRRPVRLLAASSAGSDVGHSADAGFDCFIGCTGELEQSVGFKVTAGTEISFDFDSVEDFKPIGWAVNGEERELPELNPDGASVTFSFVCLTNSHVFIRCRRPIYVDGATGQDVSNASNEVSRGYAPDNAFKSIQFGATIALADAEVRVADGTYAPFSLTNSAVRIVHTNLAHRAVIDAQGLSRCAEFLVCYSNETEWVVAPSVTNGSLRGFTLTNGRTTADGGGAFGGTLVSCQVVGCSADGNGGGLYGAEARNCLVNGCSCSTGDGAAAAASVLKNCTVTENETIGRVAVALASTVCNSIVFGNGTGVQIGDGCTNRATFVSGVIFGENWHLREGSAGVRGGLPDYVEDAVDLEGAPSRDGEKVSAGCFQTVLRPAGDVGVAVNGVDLSFLKGAGWTYDQATKVLTLNASRLYGLSGVGQGVTVRVEADANVYFDCLKIDEASGAVFTVANGNTLTIAGGTADLSGTADVTGAVVVSGGSVNLHGKKMPQAVDKSGRLVVCVEVDGLEGEVSFDRQAGYETTGMRADDAHRLYLWLPEGAGTITIIDDGHPEGLTAIYAASRHMAFSEAFAGAPQDEVGLRVNGTDVRSVIGEGWTYFPVSSNLMVIADGDYALAGSSHGPRVAVAADVRVTFDGLRLETDGSALSVADGAKLTVRGGTADLAGTADVLGAVVISGGNVCLNGKTISPVPTNASGQPVYCVILDVAALSPPLTVEGLGDYAVGGIEPVNGTVSLWLPEGWHYPLVNGVMYVARASADCTARLVPPPEPTGVTVNGSDVGLACAGPGWAYHPKAFGGDGYVELTGNGPYVLGGTNLAGEVMFSLGSSATVTLSNLCIRCTTENECCLWATNGTAVTLQLAGTNTLDAANGSDSVGEGLCIENGTRLTLVAAPGFADADAVLIARGSYDRAAIAVGRNGSDGARPFLEVAGGTVLANWFDAPARCSAGIGVSYATGKNGDADIVISGGRVFARGGSEVPGVGASDRAESGAPDILVTGGFVEAEGGAQAAGIGGGFFGMCGNVTISNGLVKATGGTGAADIAKGQKGKGDGAFTIAGGNVFLVNDAADPQPTDGAGANVYCVTVKGWQDGTDALKVAGLGRYGVRDIRPIDGQLRLWLPNGTYSFWVEGTPYAATVSGRATEAEIDRTGRQEVDYLDWNGSALVPKKAWAAPLTDVTAAIGGNNWYVVEDAVTTTNLQVNGTAHLILADGAKLTATASGNYHAGIDVRGGNALCIYGQTLGTGVLAATGGTEEGAGIGGSNKGASCGQVTINGGQVTATGGYGGAGVGGGVEGAGGTVTINGGTVRARCSGWNGSGIGAGRGASGGTVTINGGLVIAEGADWGGSGSSGPGIGGGNGNDAGTVTIAGGTVKATGRSSADDIGRGTSGWGGKVTIVGGNVLRTRNRGIQPKNAAGENVYCVTVEVESGEKVSVEGLGDYGTRDIVPIDGKVYLWMPNGVHVFSVNGRKCRVSVKDGTVSPEAWQTADYLDLNGGLPQKKSVWARLLEDGTLGAGTWYVVTNDLTVAKLTVDGSANLILADGATLTVDGDVQGGSLVVYGQDASSGRLDVAGAFSASLTVKGGRISNVTGGSAKVAGGTVSHVGAGTTLTVDGGCVFADRGVTAKNSANVAVHPVLIEAPYRACAFENLQGYGVHGMTPVDGRLCLWLPGNFGQFRVLDAEDPGRVTTCQYDVTGDVVRVWVWPETAVGVTVNGTDVSRAYGTGWAYHPKAFGGDGYVELTGNGPYVLAGTNLAGEVMFSVASSATVVLSNLCLRCTTEGECCLWATNGAAVTLQLAGTNTLDASVGSGEGLCIENGVRLKLVAAPGFSDADAVLIARGSVNRAAIAVGRNGPDGARPSCEIAGGTVFANWVDEPARYSTGIGASYATGKNGEADIVISGGRVFARGGYSVPGIGAADSENAGAPDVRIAGGQVEAVGGYLAAGIGGGDYGRFGSVTISGGTVRATGDGDTADIAKGHYAKTGGGFAVTGGSVCLTRGRADPQPTNAVGQAVYCVTVEGPESAAFAREDKPVEVVGLARYGLGGVRSLDGKVYLWLPNGEYAFSVDGVIYVATVSGSATAARLKQPEGPLEVSYLDWNGSSLVPKTTRAYALTGETSEIGYDWYVVGGEVTTTNLRVNGTAHLILADGAKLTATASGNYHAGIDVRGGNVLCIYGQTLGTGELVATGGTEEGAGIGGSNKGASCGQVTINGGQVTATGGYGGAGIGGGVEGAGGTVTINGGAVRARCSGWNGSGIGAGRGASGGTVTINGGLVIAEGADWNGSDSSGPGIGGGNGNAAGTVTIAGGTVKATGRSSADDIGRGSAGWGGTVTIVGGNVLRTRNRGIQPKNAAGENVYCVIVEVESVEKVSIEGLEGYGLNDVQPIDGKVCLWLPNGAHAFAVNGRMRTVLVQDGTVEQREGVWISTDYLDVADGTAEQKTVWARRLDGSSIGGNGWYVVTNDLTVTDLTVSGTANLVLGDGATLTAAHGIRVAAGQTLNVYAQSEGPDMGALTAQGDADCAGIGGRSGESCGTVAIRGGRIRATGGSRGAGIGGGSGGSGGTVTICGGTVSASGQTDDIGCGQDGRSVSSSETVIVGGSVLLAHGLANPPPKNADGVAVHCLAADCLESPVRLEGLPDYGDVCIQPIDGKIYLWLPDGDYRFSANGRQFVATVEGGPAKAFEASGRAKVAYQDLDGVEPVAKTVWAQAFSDGMTAVAGDWYVVTGAVTTAELAASGAANLILVDGATLTVAGDVTGGSLAVYGQGASSGEMDVGGTVGSDLTVKGGRVRAARIAGSRAKVMGGTVSQVDAGTALTVDGGSVFAKAGATARNSANVAVYGVTAEGLESLGPELRLVGLEGYGVHGVSSVDGKICLWLPVGEGTFGVSGRGETLVYRYSVSADSVTVTPYGPKDAGLYVNGISIVNGSREGWRFDFAAQTLYLDGSLDGYTVHGSNAEVRIVVSNAVELALVEAAVGAVEAAATANVLLSFAGPGCRVENDLRLPDAGGVLEIVGGTVRIGSLAGDGPLRITGGSVVFDAETIGVRPKDNGGHDLLRTVLVLPEGCSEDGPVRVEGLGAYVVDELYPTDGRLCLWIPDQSGPGGRTFFTVNGHYYCLPDGRDETREISEVKTGFAVNGVDIGAGRGADWSYDIHDGTLCLDSAEVLRLFCTNGVLEYAVRPTAEPGTVARICGTLAWTNSWCAFDGAFDMAGGNILATRWQFAVAPSNGTAAVHAVRLTLPDDVGPSAPVALGGLDGYLTDGMQAIDREVCLWLPDGEHAFTVNGARCRATVNGADTRAEYCEADVSVDGCDCSALAGTGWTWSPVSRELNLSGGHALDSRAGSAIAGEVALVCGEGAELVAGTSDLLAEKVTGGLRITGGSHRFGGTFEVVPSNGVERVFRVDVPVPYGVGDGEPVEISGIAYGTEGVVARDGFVYLWLPGATNLFFVNGVPMVSVVKDGQATAEYVDLGLQVDGVDIGRGAGPGWTWSAGTGALSLMGKADGEAYRLTGAERQLGRTHVFVEADARLDMSNLTLNATMIGLAAITIDTNCTAVLSFSGQNHLQGTGDQAALGGDGKFVIAGGTVWFDGEERDGCPVSDCAWEINGGSVSVDDQYTLPVRPRNCRGENVYPVTVTFPRRRLRTDPLVFDRGGPSDGIPDYYNLENIHSRVPNRTKDEICLWLPTNTYVFAVNGDWYRAEVTETGSSVTPLYEPTGVFVNGIDCGLLYDAGWTYDRGTGVLTLDGGAPCRVTGTNVTGAVRIRVAQKDAESAVSLTADGLVLTATEPGTSPLDVEPGSALLLAVVGESALVGAEGGAGVHVPAGASLSVISQTLGSRSGLIKACGGALAAGIGGNPGEAAGDISVAAVSVTAIGGERAAGIGGGSRGAGGDVMVINGEIWAQGGDGRDGDGLGGAGIGGGYCGGGGRTVVRGGYCEIHAGENAAAIGGGSGGDGGSVEISGGTVFPLLRHPERYARDAAAIGGGNGGEPGSNAFVGGSVVVTNALGETAADLVRAAPTNAVGASVAGIVLDSPVESVISDHNPVKIVGLGDYGVTDIYPVGGKIYLWLPDNAEGERYLFTVEDVGYELTVRNGKAEYFEYQAAEVYVNGIDCCFTNSPDWLWTPVNSNLTFFGNGTYVVEGEARRGNVRVVGGGDATVVLSNFVASAAFAEPLAVAAGERASFAFAGTNDSFAALGGEGTATLLRGNVRLGTIGNALARVIVAGGNVLCDGMFVPGARLVNPGGQRVWPVRIELPAGCTNALPVAFEGMPPYYDVTGVRDMAGEVCVWLPNGEWNLSVIGENDAGDKLATNLTVTVTDAGVAPGELRDVRVSDGEGGVVSVPVAWVLAHTAATPATSLSDMEAMLYAAGRNDGIPVWQSYVAGLDPNDPSQTFKAVIEWRSGYFAVRPSMTVPDRVYWVIASPDLDFDPERTLLYLLPSAGEVRFDATVDMQFFKVKVGFE